MTFYFEKSCDGEPQVVGVTQPLEVRFDDEPEPERERALQTVELAVAAGLRLALLGHRDGTRVRIAALLALIGQVSVTEAARMVRVHPSAISRALATLKKRLRAYARKGLVKAH